MDRTLLLENLGVKGQVPRLDEALTHSSYANEHPGAKHYEQLEFLGDAVLGMCVAEMLLEIAPKEREGALSRMRASLVSTDALAAFANKVELLKWVNFGRGAIASGDAQGKNVCADVVEAVVAAVYLANGLEAARELTLRIVGDIAMRVRQISRGDPKSRLQEYAQRGGSDLPVYVVEGCVGPDHAHEFEVRVSVGGVALGKGRGRSKKQAEKNAAQAALQHLKLQDEER